MSPERDSASMSLKPSLKLTMGASEWSPRAMAKVRDLLLSYRLIRLNNQPGKLAFNFVDLVGFMFQEQAITGFFA